MFKSFKGISDSSINQSLLKMGSRAFTSVPFQFAYFWLVAFRDSEMRSDATIWYFFDLLIFNTLIRFCLWKFGPQILARKNGQILYRSIFALSALCIGGVWGGTNAYAFLTYGLTLKSLLFFCGNMGAAATFLPMASFDILISLGFLGWTMGLPAVALSFFVHDPQAIVIACGCGLYAFLMGLLALSMNRTQIQLLLSYEKLAAQERALNTAHTQLVETHNLIHTMLESIDQAFLIFNEHGLCTNAPSEKSKALLGLDPTNKYLWEILPAEDYRKGDLAAWIQLLFLDRLEFNQVTCQGPSRAEVPSTGVMLKLKYHPLRDKAGKMTALIFTATDVTKEVKAQRKAEADRERAEMILRILTNKTNLQPFLGEVELVIEHLGAWDGADLETLRRELHTIKGGAMLFGSTTLGKNIYDAELDILGSPFESRREKVQQSGKKLKQQFTSWQNEHLQLFTQLGVYDTEKIEISRRKIAVLEQKLGIDSKARQLLNELFSTELGDVLQDFETHVTSTATKLEKSVRFHVERSSIPLLIPPQFHADVIRTFVHIFNNAVDHGLETSAQRKIAGKPEEGNISVRYSQVEKESKNWIQILIEDDGSGINTSKLREKLKARGENINGTSDLEIAMRIFDNEMSTKETVTELSGQGVGMGAVRAAVVSAGGHIRIVHTTVQGTQFEILLPDQRQNEKEINFNWRAS